MRTYILTILTGLFVLAGLQQAAAQVSVSVPRHVEQDIQRINEILQSHSNLSNDLITKLNRLHFEYQSILNKYQSSTGAEKSRYNDELINNRAEILYVTHKHFVELRNLTSQIVPLANRLINSELSSDQLNQQLGNSLSQINESSTVIKKQLRRSALLLESGGLDENAKSELLKSGNNAYEIYKIAKSHSKIMLETAEMETSRHRNLTKSFNQNIGNLLNQSILWNHFSNINIARIGFEAQWLKQRINLRNSLSELGSLHHKLQKLSVSMPEVMGILDEIIFNNNDFLDIPIIDDIPELQSSGSFTGTNSNLLEKNEFINTILHNNQ